MGSSGTVEECNNTGQDKRLEQGVRSSQPDRLRPQDGEVKSVSKSVHKTLPASAMSSGQSRDRLKSVFLTSLSAVSGTGYFQGEGMPHKRQKVCCTHDTATRVCVCVCVCVCVLSACVPNAE